MHYLIPLGFGGAVDKAEEEEQLVNHWTTTVFVEQPLALAVLMNKKWNATAIKYQSKIGFVSRHGQSQGLLYKQPLD